MHRSHALRSIPALAALAVLCFAGSAYGLGRTHSRRHAKHVKHHKHAKHAKSHKGTGGSGLGTSDSGASGSGVSGSGTRGTGSGAGGSASGTSGSGIPLPVHSVSLGWENIDEPGENWSQVESNLNAVGVNEVDLSAGRVEWTPFVWPAYPQAAADGTTDWLATAINVVKTDGSGRPRAIDLMVDSLIPNWIKSDPSIAAVSASGKRSQDYPSASALYDGPVGDRFVQYVGELAQRYHPTEISFTELMFDGGSFGADDLALYKHMMGRTDWPRTKSGAINQNDPSIGTWRSEVLANLLSRAKAEVAAVEPTGTQTLIGIDAEVNWSNPGAGSPGQGDDYNILASAADNIILWAYIGDDGVQPSELSSFTAALQSAFPTSISKFVMSIGLWDNSSTLPPAQLAAAVQNAQTNGITSVNVTPMSLMTPAHWSALQQVW